jgi:S-(hydroxymethyl)glutathione dehydrogenase/alcohol dehydrogenase
MSCANCAAGRGWLCTGTTALENSLPDGTTPFADDRGQELWPYLGLGTFTPRVVVPETAAIKVDDNLPFTVGALLGCSVTTGVGAVLNTARVPAGASAVVIGCGGVGLSVVMGLRLAGAHPIIAVDLSSEKRDKAAELGATITIDPRETDLAAYVQEHLGGADFAFEAIGNEKVIETLPGLLAPGGAAVLVGMTRIGARASIDPYDLADQGKSILGCNYGSSVARVDIPRLAKLYLAGQLPLDELIDTVRPLSDAALALQDLAAGNGLRSILTPGT